MKNIGALAISALILFVSFWGSSLAAQARTPLSGDDVRHFIAAMKPLQKLGRKYDFENRGKQTVKGLNVTDFYPMSRSLDRVKDHESYPEFTAIIQKAGFSSPEKWASMGDRIMRAYMFGRLVEGLTPEKIQDMRENMAEIKKNAYLSPDVRKKILDNLQQTMAMAHKMPENIKADQESLKPFLAKLKRLFEEKE